MKIYYNNPCTGAWEALSTSTVDTINHTVTATINHMSDYAVMGEVQTYGNAMIDLEGQAPAPGVVCKLVKDGKVVKTQRAGSDANYLFSIRSEDKARYTVEFDVQPVVKIKDEIKPIIPQIVEKPVVLEAMPEPVKADKPASTEKSIKSEHEVVITEEQEPSTVRPRNCLKGVFRKITKASVEKIAKKIIEMKPQRVVIYACGTSKADSIRLARKAEKMIEKIPGTYVNAVDFGTPNQCK